METIDKNEQPAQQGCMRCNTPKKCALHGCSPLTWPAEQPAQQEHVAVYQFRKRGCSDWYDGHPDHTDGGGPYEARTLYTSPPAQRKPLTDEEIAEACGWKAEMGCKPLPRELRIARAIEAAHGIK